MTQEEKTTDRAPAEFPVAGIRQKPSAQKLLASKMWWITLVCIIVALVLAWQSMPQTGPQINISFPEGHGLKVGDTLRHRGIDVGIVETVGLTSQLNGIQVKVELTPEAAVLCRQDTRFWIVRPSVGFTGIKGLETVVGSRYIAVSPGDPKAAHQRTFVGLAFAPPDELSGAGLDLLLQADARGGLNPGAPITWRGVQVGQVLTIGLSPDATRINVGVRINAGYRQLVRSNSKFWTTSGLGVHIGLSGIDLNADSLASLALGGISFITPIADQQAATVRNGHLFVLHSKLDDGWLKNAAAIPLINVKLPETVTIDGNTEASFLGLRRDKPFSVSGVLLRKGQTLSLLTAMLPHEQNEAGTIPELHIRRAATDVPVIVSAADVSKVVEEASGLQLIDLASVERDDSEHSMKLLRSPTQPEECFVCRTVFGDGDSSATIHSISQRQITVRDGIWLLHGDTDSSAWYGAPVVAYSDGSIIGVLTTTEQGTAVAPLTNTIVE
jgi:paraquat-inducible protein B